MEVILTKIAYPAITGLLGVVFVLLRGEVKENKAAIKETDEKFSHLTELITDIRIKVAEINTKFKEQ